MFYLFVLKIIFIPLLFLSFFLYSPSTFSEYRVYQYLVKNKNLNEKDKVLDSKSYFVTSTSDPTTYLAYHGGSETLKIDLLKTWVCRGSTANKDSYCEGPSDQNNNSSVVSGE